MFTHDKGIAVSASPKNYGTNNPQAIAEAQKDANETNAAIQSNAVNYGDASSIVDTYNNKNVGSMTNAAQKLQQDYNTVKSAPTLPNAMTYTSDLFDMAKADGAQPSDQASLNAAATEALKGAGVSDNDISSTLADEDYFFQNGG